MTGYDFQRLAILGTSETQFLLHREMSPYVEANDALLGRFVRKMIPASRSQKTVASFL